MYLGNLCVSPHRIDALAKELQVEERPEEEEEEGSMLPGQEEELPPISVNTSIQVRHDGARAWGGGSIQRRDNLTFCQLFSSSHDREEC